MQDMLSHYTYDMTILTDTNATARNVLDGIERVCENELAIIYYSGHGGTYYTQNPEEADGCDEFLVLYDYSIWDNDIWNIISQAKGNVVLIFDCCHSETMFQTVLGSSIPVMPPMKSKSCKSRILCWSACEDNASSYADRNGGLFT